MKTRSIKWKKIISKLMKIFVILFVLGIVLYNLFYLLHIIFDDEDNMEILGAKIVLVEGDSMSPDLKKGDVVLVKEVKQNDLKEQDMITYYKSESYIISRITKIQGNELIVKADNNYYNERILVDKVKGRVVGKLSGLSWLFKIMQSPVLSVIIIVILIFLLFYYQHIKQKSMQRREKLNELKKQRSHI